MGALFRVPCCSTSVDNIPNVRVVNFYYNPQNKGVVYFSSFRGHPKTLEFTQNKRKKILIF